MNPLTASTDSESEAVRSRAAIWLAASLCWLASTTSATRRSAGGDVVRDRALQVADPVDLFADVHDVQIEVLAADQVDVVERSAPDGLDHLGDELHEAAGLAVALVLLEQGDDVLDRGMERVGAVDLLGDLLGALGDGLRFDGFRETRSVSGGDGVDHGLVRQLRNSRLRRMS